MSFTLDVDSGIKDCRYLECGGDTFRIGDSYYCAENNNNEECEWDGGDCCVCDCEGYGCRGFYTGAGYVCRDTGSACYEGDADDEETEGGPTCANGFSGYDGSNSNGEVCCPVGRVRGMRGQRLRAGKWARKRDWTDLIAVSMVSWEARPIAPRGLVPRASLSYCCCGGICGCGRRRFT